MHAIASRLVAWIAVVLSCGGCSALVGVEDVPARRRPVALDPVEPPASEGIWHLMGGGGLLQCGVEPPQQLTLVAEPAGPVVYIETCRVEAPPPIGTSRQLEGCSFPRSGTTPAHRYTSASFTIDGDQTLRLVASGETAPENDGEVACLFELEAHYTP